MLNTRQGSCQACPDYGLVEVSEVLYDFPDAIGIMQRALKNTIQIYEPRLKNVQVRHLKARRPGDMTLSFEITAQLQLPDGRRQSLRFSTASTAAATSRSSDRTTVTVDTVRGGRSTVGARRCSTSTTRTS